MDKVEEMLAGIENEEVVEIATVEVKEEKTKVLKMTNAGALSLVLAIEEVQSNPELKEKLEKMLEQTNKKNAVGKTGKTGKAQEENEGIKNEILATLSENPITIKEIQLANEKISPLTYSSQKISALVKNLIAENKVIRIEEKRVAKFILA